MSVVHIRLNSSCDSATLASMQVVTALGKVWHPEHFVCTECETELGSRNFFEKDGRPYCESDYFTLFSPHCAHCNKPILNVRCSYIKLVVT